MRYAAKVDDAHPAIREGLRARGWSAEDIHRQSNGCPDLLVGAWGWFTAIIEVKSPGPPSSQALTPKETAWHARWRGLPVVVATSLDDALAKLQRAAEDVLRRARIDAPGPWMPR